MLKDFHEREVLERKLRREARAKLSEARDAGERARLEWQAQIDLSGEGIAARLQEALQDEIPEGIVNLFGAPPVEGLGTAGGFKIVIEDRGDSGPDVLQALSERLAAKGSEDGQLKDLYSS